MFLTTAIGVCIAGVFLTALLLAASAYKARSVDRRSAYFGIESDAQQQFRRGIVARLNQHAKIYQRPPAQSAPVAPLARNVKIEATSPRTSGNATAPIAGPAST